MLEPVRTKAEGERQSEESGNCVLASPRVVKERENEEPEALPGEPPKIWGAVDRPH